MKKFALLTFLLNCSLCHAAEWLEIAPKQYVDKHSYVYNEQNNSASAWFKLLNTGNYEKFEKLTNQKVWYALNKTEANCSNRTIRSLQVHLYDLKDKYAGGKNYPGEYMEIVPSTNSEVIYYTLCGMDDE